MKVGETHPFRRKFSDVGGLEIRIAKTTYPFIAHVVDHDNDQVWMLRFRGKD